MYDRFKFQKRSEASAKEPPTTMGVVEKVRNAAKETTEKIEHTEERT